MTQIVKRISDNRHVEKFSSVQMNSASLTTRYSPVQLCELLKTLENENNGVDISGEEMSLESDFAIIA